MSTSFSESKDGEADEHPATAPPQTPSLPTPGNATTSHSTLPERIEARRRDPEFLKRLKQNLDRHKVILDRLADC